MARIKGASMKRSEVEAKLKSVIPEGKRLVEQAPLQAFIVGIILGVIFVELSSLIVPLIFIAIIVIAVLWFISDPE